MANFIPKFEYEDGGTQTVNLTLPPESDPLGETFNTNQNTTRSNAGKRQTKFNYTDHQFRFTLVFLTKAEVDALKAMYDAVGAVGKSFKYFPSNDEVEFFTIYWDRKQFNPERTVQSGSDFLYDLPITLVEKL